MEDDTHITLGTASEQRFCFTCTTCGRRGRYGRESLIKMVGSTTPIEAVPVALAAKTRCVLAMNEPDRGRSTAQCGVHFDLAAMYLDDRRCQEALENRR